jgi:SWI/SNF-related matrix-associated actin-dependent regulator 1 of chromatin subfamily A
MAALITLAEVSPGWYEARFPFHRQTVDAVKAIPGSKWDQTKKVWRLPEHALPAMHLSGLVYRVVARLHGKTPPMPILSLMEKLRPYQKDGVQKLLGNPGFFLAFAPRVGKTPTATVAASSLLAAGAVRTVVILYPMSVRGEWERQFPQFSDGLRMHPITGTAEFNFSAVANNPYLVLGLHYELLRADSKNDDGTFVQVKVLDTLFSLLQARGAYAVIADEAHGIRNRKSPRAKLFQKLGAGAAFRWVLSGTPLRNYSRDMWPMWDFIQSEGMSSYSKYTARYSDGHMGDHGWMDKGMTNEVELKERLASVSFKLSRQDVAGWLPKAERQVVLCDMTQARMKVYKAQEAALGPQAVKAMNESGSLAAVGALRALSDLTSLSKIDKLIERVRFHLDRGVKVLVFANYHETLNRAWDALEHQRLLKADPMPQPIFVAGGWILPEKRKLAIETWKAHKGAAALMVNTISSGVGIDLSDAEVAIGLEATWVPADFVQMESRIEDVHLGKRSAPPLYEYLLVRGTVDEDMVGKLITKLAVADKIVGGDNQTRGIQQMLNASGVVDRNVLELTSEDPEVVEGAIASLLSRVMGGVKAGDSAAYDTDENRDAAPDEDDFDDEEKEGNDDSRP